MIRFSTALALTALLGAGCVRHSAPVVSAAPPAAHERPLGPAAGRATATYLLGLGPIGDDSVGAATADAVGQGGDGLAGITIDRRATYIPAPFFPIVTIVQTRVSGTRVVYGDGERARVEMRANADVAPSTAPLLSRSEEKAAARRRPVIWVREGLASEDFVAFFRGLRRGAAVSVSLADGRQVSGNFGRVEKSGDAVRLGKGLFGSRSVAIADIEELQSQTIRGEPIRLRREPK